MCHDSKKQPKFGIVTQIMANHGNRRQVAASFCHMRRIFSSSDTLPIARRAFRCKKFVHRGIMDGASSPLAMSMGISLENQALQTCDA